MARTTISSADLVAIFFVRLRAFSDCPPGLPIAIVPTDDGSGWSAITGYRFRNPATVKRIAELEKQLRKVYVLAKD